MKDLKTPWELFGVECGEGWFSLIEPILQYIQSYNKDKAEKYQIVLYQIKEKWAEKQNKAIYEDFTQMREHYKHEAEKQSQKVLKYFQNSKLQAEEKADRLRKENAQLRGVIEEQHKKLHPEKYIRHNKGYSL